MATIELDLTTYCRETAEKAAAASRKLAAATGKQKNHWLLASAELLRQNVAEITAANQKDIAAAPDYGLTPAETDRLRLTPERIEGIATALEEVAALPDPIGQTIEAAVRPNGLEVARVRCPLGVIFFIYESRPNVTADAAAICAKSGNAVILRGGKEAMHSSRANVDLMTSLLPKFDLPAHAV